MLLRRLLRRVFSKDKVLRRVLRREGFTEGAWKVLRRQKHILSQSTTPFTRTLRKSSIWGSKVEDRFLYSGGTDSLENFTAEFSAATPVVYKNPPPIGPEILYTTGAGEGVKVSVVMFPSSGGGV